MCFMHPSLFFFVDNNFFLGYALIFSSHFFFFRVFSASSYLSPIISTSRTIYEGKVVKIYVCVCGKIMEQIFQIEAHRKKTQQQQ